jgi:hypothetical protein
LHGELDSIQTSLKLLFTPQQKWNIVSVVQFMTQDFANPYFSLLRKLDADVSQEVAKTIRMEL